MNIGLVLIIVGLALVIAVLMFLIFRVNSITLTKPKDKLKNDTGDPYDSQVDEAVKTIFNNDFREELRNRGRLHFEKIISENAMFLQQDLQLTTSQLNDYMKKEISTKLEEEFSKYEQSIMDAKNLAIQSLDKTQVEIEKQRQMLSQQVAEQIAKDKSRLIINFEQNMAQIINHYLIEAIGNQIDLNDQLEFILSNLEDNKKAIVKDIVDGA